MGKVLSFLNFKGGVGKTTLAAHVARSLMEDHKKRVLLIDLDPQFNLTQLLMTARDIDNWDDKRTAYRLVTVIPGGPIPARDCEYAPAPETVTFTLCGAKGRNPGPAVHLVPGSFEIAHLAITQSEERRKLAAKIFREFVGLSRQFYDATIIDLNPGVSPITYTAMEHSDHIATPFINERYAYRGVLLMQEFLNDYFANKTSKAKFQFAFMNMVSAEGMSRKTQVEDRLGKSGIEILRQKVPNSPVFRTHANIHGTIYDEQIARMRSQGGQIDPVKEILKSLSKEIADVAEL